MLCWIYWVNFEFGENGGNIFGEEIIMEVCVDFVILVINVEIGGNDKYNDRFLDILFL